MSSKSVTPIAGVWHQQPGIIAPSSSIEDLERLAVAEVHISHNSHNSQDEATSNTHLNSHISLISQSSARVELPRAALYGLAGDIVRSIEPHSEADPSAILVQALTLVGNVMGPQVYCSVEATRHRLNLFTVLVGESSKARKGTSWNQLKDICDRVDLPWSTDRITGGLSSAEGLISELQDSEEAPRDKRLLIVQGEFAGVLKVMSREGNTLSASLRDAWDHGNLRTMVKREPQRATGAHVSLVGHITRLELLRYLSDTEAHNGFANRLLWCSVRRSKFLPEGGRVPERDVAALASRLRRVVEWSTTCTEMRRDDAARKLWAAVYPKLSDGLPGLLGAATSRAEAQVLRISAIYAALDCSSLIKIEHLQAALALWDYSFASAKFIFGDALGDPVADRIREALEGAGEDGLTRTQMSSLFGRHASTDRISQALDQLRELGLADRLIVRGDGRSAELWTAK